MKDWKGGAGHWGACEAWTPPAPKGKEIKDTAKFQRYNDCNTQIGTLRQGMTNMRELRPKLAEQVLQLQERKGMAEKDVKHITEAADEVIESMRVVANTYIYRFFAHGDKGEALYRMQQLDLNQQLGELQQMLEGRALTAEERARPEFRGKDFKEPAFKELLAEGAGLLSQTTVDAFNEERRDITDRTKRMATFRFQISESLQKQAGEAEVLGISIGEAAALGAAAGGSGAGQARGGGAGR